ncbi:MAG: winged helix-turn-helix domain-containing protein [Terracidiphilus sp.]|jgi:DNA-binding winged helix-turn-helix (wHTH) protein/Tol biopolymer transport system component
MSDYPNGRVSQVSNGNGTVRFGAFEADLFSGEIRKSGSRVKLQEQPFKVLQVLLERPGVLVTREELRSRIWPDESYGDFDHAVNVAVGKLRTALGDSADNPCFIETIPRRGYRFVAPLEGSLAETKPAKPPATSGRASGGKIGRGRVLLATIAVAAAGILLAAGVLLGRRTAKPSAPEFQRLTARHGTVYSARFAPDGHNVVYTASWDGAPVEIFSTDVSFPGTRSVGLQGTALLAVSSTGEMAVAQAATPEFITTLRGTLGQVPLTGGSPRQIAENVDWADWAPDGGSLAIVRDMAGRQRLEYPVGHVLYQTTGWISHPRISPKGDQVAFLDHPTYMDDRGVVSVVDLAGQKRVLSKGWESEEGLAWFPLGNEVWFSATETGLQRRIYAVDLLGHLRQSFSAPGGVTLQDIAPDGRLLLTRDEQRAGIMASTPGAMREQDLSWLDWSLPIALSPDGNEMVFDEQGDQGGPTYTVAVRDLRGSPPVPLGGGMAGGFSPNGKWVAATINYGQLVLLPSGAGTSRRVDSGGIQQYGHPILWLPDGKQLVFSGELAGRAAQCFIQNIEVGKPRAVTPEGVTGCQPSPDGKWIAARDMASKQGRLYPVDGGEPHAVPGLLPGENFAWTSDPKFMYASQGGQTSWKIYRLNIVTGQRQLFKEVIPTDVTGLCGLNHIILSANGRSYVYGYTRLLSDLYLVKGLQ